MNGHIPDLGQIGQSPSRATVNIIGVLVRDLDQNGTFAPESVVMTEQGPQAIPGRANIVTAEDLVEMMREMMREELSNAVVYILKQLGADKG